MAIVPGYTAPDYFIPVSVALSRFNQRQHVTGAWLREAIASLEHHATLADYDHIKAELIEKAGILNAIVGGN